jgi:hypothetical protein
MPQAAHLKPKQMQRRGVHTHPVVADVARNNPRSSIDPAPGLARACVAAIRL